MLYSRAAFAHPSLTLLGPSQEFCEQLKVRRDDGEWEVLDAAAGLPEHLRAPELAIFIDGSCTTPALAERRRAAWAVVWVTPNGDDVAVLSGVVEGGSMPQSPQAAEFTAAYAAAQFATGDQVIYSDCANVVRQCTNQELSGKLRYSGLVRLSMALPGWKAATSMVKVKAHVVRARIPHRTRRRDEAPGSPAAAGVLAGRC